MSEMAAVRRLFSRRSALAAVVVLACYAFFAVFAPLLCQYEPNEMSLSSRFAAPSLSGMHLLGTDHLGRDLLTRVLYGARVSLVVGIVTVSISAVVGTITGMAAGYYGGPVDAVLCKITEVLLSFPYLIFAIGAMAVLGPGFWNLVTALCFKSWVEFFRLSRASTISEKAKEYVEAARLLGEPDLRLMVTEILPNIAGPIVVLATLRTGTMMVLESSLSFLGLGIPPQIPAWGSMIRDGYRFLFKAWWLSLFPAFFLAAAVLAINVLGETLRDVLDPGTLRSY